MVDPFQVLDNGNNSSGTNENSEIIVIQQNMNEKQQSGDNLGTSVNAKYNDLTAKDIDTSIDKDVQKSLAEEQNQFIMGGPSNHEAELIVMPSCSNSTSIQSINKETTTEIVHADTSESTSECCVDKIEELNYLEPAAPLPLRKSQRLNCSKKVSIEAQACETITNLVNDCEKKYADTIENTGLSDKSSSVVLSSNVSSASSPPQLISSTEISSNCVDKLIQVESPKIMDENNHNSNSSPTSTTEIPNMDNRKVEPLKINIHREPIKTIIKIPKTMHENSVETVPKITIKQILKSQNEDVSEAIPKLTLIVDSSSMGNNSISNLEPPPEPHIVPKLTIRNSTNSTGSGSQSEIVPKLTIKMDNHVPAQNNNKEKCLVLDDGVKVTIKPIPEPPIPKLTIKASTNDRADVINNSNLKYSINAGPSSPISRLNIKPYPKTPELNVPKLKIKPILKPDESSEQVSKFTVTRADETSSSTSSAGNDLKLVPKLLVKVPKEKDSELLATDSDTNEQTEHDFNDDDIPRTIIKRVHEPCETETVPKLTIRQVKSIEQQPEENIVIPKVTIKPIVNPDNDSQDQETLITPKITIKPIPKPIDITQPLEVVTTNSPFKSITESADSQHSPRIILKINKNIQETASKNDQGKEAVLAKLPVEKLNQDAQISSSLSSNENDLKRASTTVTSSGIEVKKSKIENDVVSVTNTTEIICLDSEEDDDQKPQINSFSHKSQIVHEDSKLIDILTRMHRTNHQNDVSKQIEEIIPENVLEPTPVPLPPPIENIKKPMEKLTPSLEFNNSLFPLFHDEDTPQILHPLLMQNIERAKLLEAMMNANEESPKEMPNNIYPHQDSKPPNLIIMSEGSSSDCIMVEDNGSSLPFPINFKVNKNGQNKKEQEGSIDRDSGVDVSNSVKSVVEEVQEETPPPVKRGRGRPRKDGTPAGSAKKKLEEQLAKRKFAGVLMSQHNAKAIEIKDIVPIDETKVETKEKKRRIRIDDDDESPTFNPLARGIRRGRGRGGRGSRGRGSLRYQRRSGSISILSSPEKSRDGIFTTPEGKDRRKLIFKENSTPSLQVFEEDTRMSADSLITAARNVEFLHNDESQSSLLSIASATVEGTTAKKRCKIEVVDPEGKTEFTVDMIAEYDWPPPKGCCPARNRDTYMIQEQVAEYLGVKSFKRKYQDLPRRMVEMEERNYLMEKGLVSEKMCDLGLTAVLASDVLDIMHNDFYEKYEEYKKYLREKHIKGLAAKQKAIQMEAVEKNLSARDNAIRAASSWNISFNKSRKEDRRQCLDLQNLVIQIPEGVRKKMSRPLSNSSNYPVALVPGQFQEYYRQYNAAELLCYPINTALTDPVVLDKRLREYSKTCTFESDSDSSSSDSDDSSDDSFSESSYDSSDCETRTNEEKCRVCDKPQNINRDNKPEIFISCSTCRRRAHPSCIEMPPRMSKRVQEYAWQCSECKHCSKCRQIVNHEKMLFCDQCDRGYHIYCIGLKTIPSGRWHCSICSICTICGSRNPYGHKNPNLTAPQRNKLFATSKWTHEYRINHISNLREHSATLCTPCVRLKSVHTPT